MTCAFVHELILSSLDGSLSAPDQTELDGHLGSCPDCVTLMKGYVVAAQLLRGWDEADASDKAPALPESLVRSILAAKAADETSIQRKRTTG